MKNKVDFGEEGVLTWHEALLNPEICLDSLLSFAENDEEMEICLNAGLLGDDLPPEYE